MGRSSHCHPSVCEPNRDTIGSPGRSRESGEKRFGTRGRRALRSALENIIAKQEEDGRSTLGLGLVPPAGVARAGAVVPALGRRDVAAAARQRARDIVEQTEGFLEDPKGSLPHYPLWDMDRGFGP